MIMILDIGVVAASSIVSEESTNNLYDVIIVGVPELETYKVQIACRTYISFTGQLFKLSYDATLFSMSRLHYSQTFSYVL